MAPVPSVWNHQSDKDLLLAIIEEKGQLKWPNISEQMQAKGYTFTKEACRQHFQKIRKEARSGGSNNGGSSPVRPAPVFKVTKPSTSAKSTPRKPKSTTDSFQTANGSFSTKNGSFDNSYVDDDEEMTTPVKRQRTVKMEGQGNSQSAPVFKIEGQGVEHEPIDLENDDLYNGEPAPYYDYA